MCGLHNNMLGTQYVFWPNSLYFEFDMHKSIGTLISSIDPIYNTYNHLIPHLSFNT